MAKRRVTNRLSKQWSINRSSSIGSGHLDPDTNILGEDKTLWWKNLEENLIPPRSSTHNHGNETSVQLSFNSDLNATYDKSNWWKQLELDEQNTSTLKHNYSAEIIKTHVMEMSTSESEKEPDTKRRKLPLRAASRRSDSNVFLNALNDNTTVSLKQVSTYKNVLDKEVLQRQSHKNKNNSSNLETGIMEGLQRKNVDSVTASIQNIDKVQGSDESNSETLRTMPVKHKPQFMRRTRQTLTSNAFKDVLSEEKIQSSDESNSDTLYTMPVKHKSRFMRQTRQSLTSNAFKDVLSEDTSESEEIPSSRYSPTDIHSTEAPPARKSSDNSSRSISKSNSNIEKNTSLSRSSKHISSPKNTSSQRIDTYDAKSSPTTKSRSLDNSSKLNKLVDSSKSKIDTNKNISGNVRNTSLTNDNPSQDIDTFNTKSPTESGSLVGSPKRLISSSKNKIDIDKTTFSRSSRHVSISKDIDNPIDIQLSDAESPLITSSPIVFLNRLPSGSKSGIDIDKNISLSKSLRHTSIPKDNSNQNIELSNAVSLAVTRSRSLVGSPKRLASGSKNKFDIDKNISISRSSRRTSISNNLSQDIEPFDAASPSVTGSRSPVGTPKRFASDSKSKIDIDKNASISRSSRRTSISKNLSQDIELFDAAFPSVTGSRSPVGTPKRLAGGSKSKIDIDKNASISRSSRRTSISKNLSQDIEPFDAASLSVTGSRSPVGSPKRLASNSKSKIDTDKNASISRNSRRTSISKNLSQDIEPFDAASPSVTGSRSPVGSPKRLASGSKSKIDIDKNTPFSKRHTSMSKDNPSHNIELSDAVSPSESRSPVSSPKTLASRSKIDINKNISISKNVMDPSSSKDNLSRNALDTSDATSSSARRSSKFLQKSKNKIDKNISVDRSPRSSLGRPNERLLDISSDEESQNYNLEIERSSGNSTQVNAKRSENVASLVETEKDDHEDILTAQNKTRMNKSKTITRPTSSIASYFNKDSQRENRETLRQSKSLKESDFQNHSIPIKRPLHESTIAFNISKIVKKTPRTIDTFFKQSSSTANKQSSSNNQNLVLSQDFNEKMKRIKVQLEGIKKREITVMKRTAIDDKKKSASNARNAKPKGNPALKQDAKKTPAKVTVDKAFLVNGKVYRAPRLPRPKHWATDNLYQFLWKRMEPKYKLATRVKSEKFVQELAKIVSFIERHKKYETYKHELEALMKEMARLCIIRTRNDFYDFCFQFLPYEFRVKVIPMLLPGNKKNIPYDPEKLHTSLLNNNK